MLWIQHNDVSLEGWKTEGIEPDPREGEEAKVEAQDDKGRASEAEDQSAKASSEGLLETKTGYQRVKSPAVS